MRDRREQLISEMKNLFGSDMRRIDHALKVLSYAEEILAKEGGSPLVVITAAILHDIGIHEAERKYNSSAAKYQEIEGPPIAKKIMEGIGIEEPIIKHVCRIVANHHSAKDIDTLEFRIVWDSDWLVNIPEEFATESKTKLKHTIDGVFKTTTGKEKAYQLFLS